MSSKKKFLKMTSVWIQLRYMSSPFDTIDANFRSAVFFNSRIISLLSLGVDGMGVGAELHVSLNWIMQTFGCFFPILRFKGNARQNLTCKISLVFTLKTTNPTSATWGMLFHAVSVKFSPTPARHSPGGQDDFSKKFNTMNFRHISTKWIEFDQFSLSLERHTPPFN